MFISLFSLLDFYAVALTFICGLLVVILVVLCVFLSEFRKR